MRIGDDKDILINSGNEKSHRMMVLHSSCWHRGFTYAGLQPYFSRIFQAFQGWQLQVAMGKSPGHKRRKFVAVLAPKWEKISRIRRRFRHGNPWLRFPKGAEGDDIVRSTDSISSNYEVLLVMFQCHGLKLQGVHSLKREAGFVTKPFGTTHYFKNNCKFKFSQHHDMAIYYSHAPIFELFFTSCLERSESFSRKSPTFQKTRTKHT